MATHVDIVAQFDDRSVMVSANDLKRNLERSGDEAGDAWAAGFQRSAPKIQQAYEKAYGGAEKAASSLRAEEAKLTDVRARAQKEAEELATKEERLAHFRQNLPGLTETIAAKERELADLRDSHSSTIARLTVRSEALARAHVTERSALSDLSGAFRDVSRGVQDLESGASNVSSILSGMGNAIGQLGIGAGRAAPAGIVALGAVVVELGGVAASAAQSLWLLPAAAGAAGAAIGTVALATYGFSDALKAVGDPKKFGEALQQLSPNAQQAALSIQALMPAFTELRKATSDAFFANIGPQLNQLTNQFLPTIQSMTTGIAGAFNQAFSGVAQQLMTPQTQQAIQTFTTNVVAAFQKLAPAVAPLVSAFAEIAKVGSGFLPGLAQAATQAAQAFSSFISQKAATGELQRWLSEGLDTLKQLVPVAIEFGKAFMSLAPLGQAVLPDIVTALKSVNSIMPAIGAAALLLGPSFGALEATIGGVGKAFGAIEGIVKNVANSIIPTINLIGETLSNALAPVRAAAALVGLNIPAYSPISQITSGDTGNGTPGVNRTSLGGSTLGTAGLPGVPAGGYPLPGASGQWWHGSGVPGSAGYGWGNPPPATRGTGSGTGLPQSPQTPYNSSLPPGFANLPQTASLYSAETNYMDANTALATKQARLDQLQKVNNATAADIQKARNDVITAEHTQHEAELRLYTARDELYKKSNAQMNGYANQLSEIGVKLDQDLGISKGLAGMADNLVRFLGSLALAPWEAQQNAISNAPGQAQGGFGAIGIAGAQGAFGPQYTAAGQQAAAAAASSSASALGPAALQPGGAYAGDAALLANVPAGRYTQTQGADLTKGLADCSSAVEDLVNLMDGRPTAGRAMSTGNEADWLTQHGFMPTNQPMPGAFQVGFNSGHTQATLPGGTPFNWGSDSAAARGGVGGTGAWDPAFTSHFYRPVDGSTGAPVTSNAGVPASAGVPAATGSYGGQSFPVPLPVTIVGGALDGGGGFPGLGAPGAGAPGGAPGAPGAAPSPTPGGSLGLNNPPAPGGGGAWTSPGLPPIAPGSGGQGPLFGANPLQPVGAGVGAPGSQIGAAVGPPKGTGSGGVGMTEGGLLDTAIGLGAAAFPGVGQAAQTGIKLANRAIKFAGQAAAIGVQGIQQTFLPTGGSELANNSWFSKILGGIAGAAPALPNMAGKPAAPTGQGQQGQQGQQGGGDTHNNITVNNQRPTEDGTGKDIAWNMQNMYQPAGKP